MGHAAKVILLGVLALVLWLASLVAAMAVYVVACSHGNVTLGQEGPCYWTDQEVFLPWVVAVALISAAVLATYYFLRSLTPSGSRRLRAQEPPGIV